MRYIATIVLIAAAGSAQGSLLYELTPDLYLATPGGTIQTFATVTNSGTKVLSYAYSFVDPGDIPASGLAGQLPPLVLYPGDVVYFRAATITTHPGTVPGRYSFIEGVGYYHGLSVSDVLTASDAGTLVVVPEPASLLLCAPVLLAFWRPVRR